MRLRFSKAVPVLALSGLLFSASSALAGPIDPASSGLDQAQGCGDSPCAFDVIYNLDASAPVTGDLEITGSTLDFTISLASATLSGSDGAVSSIDFSGVTYSGSFAITLDGSGGATITDQIATITGTVTPDIGGAVVFNAINVNTTGLCTGVDTASPTCGLIFGGPTSDFSASVDGNTRYFRHTVDVSVVPEPGTALLLGLGLSGLASLNRRRS
ncbi:MAG: PEP-CTERM sorting domain-containing protein [bacterium]|nr:PEP-CTERM sorting domain-containing protein [bacterium]